MLSNCFFFLVFFFVLFKGKIRSWSRKGCDDTFYDNMIAVCDGKYKRSGKKRSAFFSRLVEKVRQKVSRTKNLFKASVMYLTARKGTLDKCYKAANLFYLTVQLFGSCYYRPNDRTDPDVVCNYRCTPVLGSPGNILKVK